MEPGAAARGVMKLRAAGATFNFQTVVQTRHKLSALRSIALLLTRPMHLQFLHNLVIAYIPGMGISIAQGFK
jgi:hypothetical protein